MAEDFYIKKPDNKADIGKKYWIWDLMGTVYVCVQWEGEMKGREEQVFFGSALLYVYAFCSIMQSFHGTEVSSSGFGSQLCHFSIIWTWVNYSFPHWKSQDNTYFSFSEGLVENMGFPGGSVDLGNGKTHCSILAWEIPWTGAWQAAVHGVAEESDVTLWLNNSKVESINTFYLFLAALGLPCCVLVFSSCRSVTTVNYALCFKLKYSKIYKKVKVHCGLEEFRVVYQK